MKHYEVVCALIFNENDEVFICKRGPNRALCGFWEFPGGKVEEKETYEETIVREIKEELKGDIQPIEYIGESSYEYHNLAPYNDFSITLYAYKCSLIKGPLVLTEHTDSAWVKKENLKDYVFANADRPIVELIQKHK